MNTYCIENLFCLATKVIKTKIQRNNFVSNLPFLSACPKSVIARNVTSSKRSVYTAHPFSRTFTGCQSNYELTSSLSIPLSPASSEQFVDLCPKSSHYTLFHNAVRSALWWRLSISGICENHQRINTLVSSRSSALALWNRSPLSLKSWFFVYIVHPPSEDAPF